MATQRSAQVDITNGTDGTALIQLYHNNSSNGTQNGAWIAAPGQTVGPLTVLFETGWGSYTILDYWYVRMIVMDGGAPGIYNSSGPVVGPLKFSQWKECQLQSADAAKTLTFGVTKQTFSVNLDSTPCSADMYLEGQYNPDLPVANVFVLMLENHSFDNMFAFSNISGLNVATSANSNTYTPPTGSPVTNPVSHPAPPSMPTDPGHEFLDVVQQLGGQTATYPPYPSINNSGFLANYAVSTTEAPTSPPPPPADWPDIMACFDTPTQLPVILELANEFAICDQWFSSLPGPTWPNRFFVHGASSSGEDDSPGKTQMGIWETPGLGFVYPNGSIYDAMDAHAPVPVQWRLYNDNNGPLIGSVPQVSALKNITLCTSNDFYPVPASPCSPISGYAGFAADLQSPYPYRYTFIEPNYGDSSNNTYEGGSSQHPMDGVWGGENLIKNTYEAIRNSPLWESSVLIITYDEHGGFYDHCTPPAAVPPGDNPGTNGSTNYSTHKFGFDILGVRVPAVIVSPLIAKGVVDSTTYDHTSVLKTLELAVGLQPLTKRDAAANSLQHLFTVPAALPRQDCPTTLLAPSPKTIVGPMLSAEDRAAMAQQPLPESGNLHGVLGVLLKAELEHSDGSAAQRDAILENFKRINTRGAASAYAAKVFAHVQMAKANDAISVTSGKTSQER